MNPIDTPEYACRLGYDSSVYALVMHKPRFAGGFMNTGWMEPKPKKDRSGGKPAKLNTAQRQSKRAKRRAQNKARKA